MKHAQLGLCIAIWLQLTAENYIRQAQRQLLDALRLQALQAVHQLQQHEADLAAQQIVERWHAWQRLERVRRLVGGAGGGGGGVVVLLRIVVERGQILDGLAGAQRGQRASAAGMGHRTAAGGAVRAALVVVLVGQIDGGAAEGLMVLQIVGADAQHLAERLQRVDEHARQHGNGGFATIERDGLVENVMLDFSMYSPCTSWRSGFGISGK